MSEWRLFPEGTVPDFSTPEFFAAHPHIEPAHQIGHAERMRMTANLVNDVIDGNFMRTVADLGCGDGSLLDLLDPWHYYHGFDACVASVDVARAKGHTVTLTDIRDVDTSEFDLVIASEVIEHMVDPHGFVAGIKSPGLILTSPAHEDGDWHYPHHAWAWDVEGYADLARRAGWKVIAHDTCAAPAVDHGSGPRDQLYQAIACVRSGE